MDARINGYEFLSANRSGSEFPLPIAKNRSLNNSFATI